MRYLGGILLGFDDIQRGGLFDM